MTENDEEKEIEKDLPSLGLNDLVHYSPRQCFVLEFVLVEVDIVVVLDFRFYIGHQSPNDGIVHP